MIFTLEALQADHGDSLLLHYGSTQKPRRLLIDAGPPAAWKKSVKPRLLQMRGDADTGPTIDLLMVSHIDDDHVGGVVTLTRELRKAHERGDPAPYEILELWHNAFEDLLEDDDATAAIAAATPAGGAAAADTGLLAKQLPFVGPGAAVVASVNQGRQLRDDASLLELSVNRDFDGLVRRTAHVTTWKDAGLTLSVLGPSEERLERLQREWKAILKKKKKGNEASWMVLVADFVDNSVFNLSSIIVLAQAATKTMLLTGDARGDDILQGLEAANLLQDGAIHVDVFKVPHHGSDRTVSTAFFEAVTADHYVISANGRDGNPDLPMLEMLSMARGDDEYEVILTNEVEHATVFYDDDQPTKSYTVRVRDASLPSISVQLADDLPEDLKPKAL